MRQAIGGPFPTRSSCAFPQGTAVSGEYASDLGGVAGGGCCLGVGAEGRGVRLLVMHTAKTCSFDVTQAPASLTDSPNPTFSFGIINWKRFIKEY